MEYIGIAFKAYFAKVEILPNLFVDFPLEEYDWYIDDCSETHDKDIKEGIYTGEEFRQFLKGENQLYTIRILCYPKRSIEQNIEKYIDYKNSDCIFALLVVDCECYEVYTKICSVLERIEIFCKQEGIEYELTTEENDGRYTFHAF